MARTPRTSSCGIAEARGRLRIARAYLDTAELVHDEMERQELLSVSAGLAVLAGIAASDSTAACDSAGHIAVTTTGRLPSCSLRPRRTDLPWQRSCSGSWT